MDLDVAIRAVRVLRIQVVLRTCRFVRTHAMRHAMTGQTELRYPTGNQQAWIGRPVWSVARDAPVGFDRRMFVNKGTLFVCVTLHACCIGARR